MRTSSLYLSRRDSTILHCVIESQPTVSGLPNAISTRKDYVSNAKRKEEHVVETDSDMARLEHIRWFKDGVLLQVEGKRQDHFSINGPMYVS